MAQESQPSRIDRLLDLLHTLAKLSSAEAVDAIGKLWKFACQALAPSAPQGMYEVLDYDGQLEIRDRRGRLAVFEKRERVRFLQDNVIAYQDLAWGDGPYTVTWDNLIVTGVPVLEEGMATGGGWFIPEDDTFVGGTPGGRASFGFVARNRNAAASGNLEFQYHADRLSLRSTSLDWVNVANTQVIFEGTGLLNGTSEVRFRVQAVDGDKLGTGIDRFVIRIWNPGSTSPTYRAEGNLGGGQIVVHKK